MKKALVFPGIGYHTDKPLLYYSKKIAAEHGYEVIDIAYSGFPTGVRGNVEKMKICFEIALQQTEEQLRGKELNGEILILAKSVGTAVAAVYTERHDLNARFVYYTPLVQTLQYAEQGSGIAFSGSADPWVETDALERCCTEKRIPLTLFPDADHSLETGTVSSDLLILERVMRETEQFISIGDRGNNI